MGQTAPPRWRKLAGSGATCGLSHEAAHADLSHFAVCFDPGDITIDERLHEFSRVIVHDLACFVDRRGIVLDEHFRLAERRYIEIGKHVAQMLLRESRAGCAWRCPGYGAGFVTPRVFAPRTRPPVQRILQYTGIDRLYSGVTNSKPSAASIFFLNSTATAGKSAS
jgi:hypothetical protein